MFKVKLYEYNNDYPNKGYRGKEYTKYILQGSQFTEDITQVLDTSEITLSGLPQKESFAPETKFIADIIKIVEDEEIIVETLHLCVSRDMVTQPILSDNNYYEHHISFIEPSVIAQKRLVDNIAVTYKLKDVSLEVRPNYPTDNIAAPNFKESVFTPPNNFGTYLNVTKGVRFGKYFELENSDIVMINNAGTEYSTAYNDIENFATGDETNPYQAQFRLPKLKIMHGVIGSKNFAFLGYASIDYRIFEGDLNDDTTRQEIASGTCISNSELNGVTFQYTYSTYFHETYNGEWLIESTQGTGGIEANFGRVYYKKYTDTTKHPSTLTEKISLKPNLKYTIEISLHNFPDTLDINSPDTSYSYRYLNSTNNEITQYWDVLIGVDGGLPTNPREKRTLLASQTSGSTFAVTYNLDAKTIVYSSSTPYSALALLQKAIINSSTYEKKDGVYIADINNSDLPFYVDENYIDRLKGTQIIENFYNQKNLWEILVEVGNYIHAIPELKFGDNGRFMITFNELGRTDEKPDLGNKVSIFNSRSVEDYISATSSYVANMVQLNGIIEEWVAPKTTDETYLVHNGTAQIIVSKPIIELVKVQVRNNTTGDIADMTDFVYEENIYKTLSIKTNVVPNRGIAMYYSLGDNIIKGGDYRTPTKNDGDVYNDFAIKKIIYSAFNGYPTSDIVSSPWVNIQVENYTFFVQYRTKDSVRQNHIRPDLRKYLRNSVWDKIPEYNQFNNQQDVVVDSIKFGNNLFGKLIKTGNNSYEVWEWHDTYDNVKHKGELYRLNSELYYVAKVTHYIYSSHILSKVGYSKDYNELSSIIGIPSEPRFYEISKQSLIRREVCINDLIYLTDNGIELQNNSNYILNLDHLADLMFGTGTTFAKYAITVFKGDKDTDKYDQTIGQKDTYIEIISPINAYSSYNTLTYEWSMVDNYSAGDQITNTEKDYYLSLSAVQYTDIYGKAPLMDFYIIEDLPEAMTSAKETFSKIIQDFPESPIKTKLDDTTDTRTPITDVSVLASNVKTNDTNYNGRGIGLLKDCREAISINYNLQFACNSDTFVLSPFIFSPNKKEFKIVLLSEEVNKFSIGYISGSKILTPTDTNGKTMSPFFDFDTNKTVVDGKVTAFNINISTVLSKVNDKHFTGADNFPRIKAIAILYNLSKTSAGEYLIADSMQFVLARNIPTNWVKSLATRSWVVGSPNYPYIFKRQ